MKVRIGPYRKNRAKRVEIEPFDTWSMDHTLALIILPMLIQLKETMHGAPMVEECDVPLGMGMSEEAKVKYEELGEPDGQFFLRWKWVLDEMIWAFEQKTFDDGTSKYYGSWIDKDDEPLGGHFEWIDDEGIKKHQERMTNGFRLFGKYYESLWD